MAGGTGLTTYLAGCASHTATENSGNNTTNTYNRKETEQAPETATFAVVATYPANTSDTEEHRRQTLLTTEDIIDVSSVKEGKDGQLPFVRVQLTDESARRFVEVMKENGFTDDGTGKCRWKQNPDNPGWCLLTVVDGTVTYAAGVGKGLASMIESGKYLDNPMMIVHTNTVESAEEIRAAIENRTDSRSSTTRVPESSS